MRTFIFSGFLFLLPFTANADGDGDINFSGRLSLATCNANVNGSGSNNATVSLPTVQAGNLSTAGSTAGQTAFSVSVSGCGTGLAYRAYFEHGATVDADSGRLNNMAVSSAATRVQLQLLDVTLNYAPVFIGNSSQKDSGYARTGGATAVIPYAVRYYATGTAGAGVVSSSVVYSILYQ